MINTDPPIWYLDIVLKDGREKRISLTTEQLQNPIGFQKRCMEVLQEMPPVLKREDWTEVVNELMASVKIIDVPMEMTREGQFMDIFGDFLSMAGGKGSSEEDILRGLAWFDDGSYYFRLRDLNQYMTIQRFTQLAPNEILAAIKNTLKGERVFKKINDKGMSLWKVTLDKNNPTGPSEPKPVNTPEPF